ncbi:Uncharacterized protein TCM_041197 [Theobroma cacao]|uniref:Uncharacterized protein n=1 Tax=Theobroma cacao TaxID=3641 RepID=A0A061GZL5_THECC|nr:Uncharacterized protein TCM_041197 [Theobroma cacao]
MKNNKTQRIGVLPRHARNDSEMKWVQLNSTHIINAWENGDDEIILVTPNVVSLGSTEYMFDRIVNIVLEKVSVNIKTKKSSWKNSFTKECGAFHKHLLCRKGTRYAYLEVLEEVLKMSGVVKLDLETRVQNLTGDPLLES